MGDAGLVCTDSKTAQTKVRDLIHETLKIWAIRSQMVMAMDLPLCLARPLGMLCLFGSAMFCFHVYMMQNHMPSTAPTLYCVCVAGMIVSVLAIEGLYAFRPSIRLNKWLGVEHATVRHDTLSLLMDASDFTLFTRHGLIGWLMTHEEGRFNEDDPVVDSWISTAVGSRVDQVRLVDTVREVLMKMIDAKINAMEPPVTPPPSTLVLTRYGGKTGVMEDIIDQ